MKLSHRRQFLHLAAGAAALPALPRIARAQAYPSRPVRLVVPYAPGGGTDIVARLMGQWLSERLGQQFVIENRPGAGTNIGTEAVVRAPADGYMILLFNSAAAINATLYDKLNFNFIRDLAPIAGIIQVPLVMAVNPSVPAKTVPEFITYAKANPGRLNMASGGNGSANHMSGELFKMMTTVNMVHVPYRGAGPAITDLLGGQVQVMFGAMPSSIEYIKAGRLRPLAVTTATRSDELPDVPTVGDFVPGYEASDWQRPQGHPRRNRPEAQQRNQHRSCRPQNESAVCRSRRHGTCGLARRLRKVHRRRNREVGEGGQALRCKTGLTRQSWCNIP